jgi:transposase
VAIPASITTTAFFVDSLVDKRSLSIISIKGQSPVFVTDRKKGMIELVAVETEGQRDSEYYLKVISEGKALKESSMHRRFAERFEEGLRIIGKGITGKYGTKKYDKVNHRICRLKQKYPSVKRMYRIEIEKNDQDICLSLHWERIEEAEMKKQLNHGVYFIRTTLPDRDETLVWKVYNCIREIESSFRCLKSDLELRPVFHRTDEACEAHLHLGLLSYWMVNTIRFQLKKEDIHSDWRELVRIMNTQKCVTTKMDNDKGECLWIRCRSEPNEKTRMIYAALEMKQAPFLRKKSVALKTDFRNKGMSDLQKDTS